MPDDVTDPAEIASSLTGEERLVLLETSRREAVVAKLKPPAAWRTWDVRDHSDLKKYGPRYNTSDWFGGGEQRMPDRWQRRFLRLVHSLEDAGLLELTTTEGGRLAHCRLSEEGRAVVAAIEAPEKKVKRGRTTKRNAGAAEAPETVPVDEVNGVGETKDQQNAAVPVAASPERPRKEDPNSPPNDVSGGAAREVA